MKLKNIIVSVAALAAGLAGVAFAAEDYLPPERLHCTLSTAGKLSCADFNRQYLAENAYTADLETGKDILFTFASGAAFTTTNEWAVFYTYKSTDNKIVKLRTINTSIQPDLQKGAWTAVKDFYTCTAGYMSCPLTNLPSKA